MYRVSVLCHDEGDGCGQPRAARRLCVAEGVWAAEWDLAWHSEWCVSVFRVLQRRKGPVAVWCYGFCFPQSLVIVLQTKLPPEVMQCEPRMGGLARRLAPDDFHPDYVIFVRPGTFAASTAEWAGGNGP